MISKDARRDRMARMRERCKSKFKQARKTDENINNLNQPEKQNCLKEKSSVGTSLVSTKPHGAQKPRANSSETEPTDDSSSSDGGLTLDAVASYDDAEFIWYADTPSSCGSNEGDYNARELLFSSEDENLIGMKAEGESKKMEPSTAFSATSSIVAILPVSIPMFRHQRSHSFSGSTKASPTAVRKLIQKELPMLEYNDVPPAMLRHKRSMSLSSSDISLPVVMRREQFNVCRIPAPIFEDLSLDAASF